MADNEELSKALKDLPLRVQTSSRKNRNEILSNVASVLSHPGITENLVKGICKTLQLTLPRYCDGQSRSYVKNTISALIKEHPDWTMKYLTAILADSANQNLALVSTKNIAQSGLFALEWSSLLVEQGLGKCSSVGKGEFQRLVETQSIILSIIVAAGNKKRTNKAYKVFCRMWRSSPEMVELYGNALSSLPATAHTVVFGSYFLQFLGESKQNDIIEKYKPNLLDILLKVGVSCKVQPPAFLLDEARPLLLRVKHDEFSQLLLPAMQKAMLRNPEIILQSVGKILQGVSIDLSQYALDIGKSLTTNLHSKEDLARQEATDACKYLAAQCSDASALESLLQHMFKVFHGSEGKLTVATHKISILEGAGNLSYNALSGTSVQSVALVAADHFIKVLEIEVHEKTLIKSLEMLSLWCAKFTTQTPTRIINWLMKGIGLKTSTASVRTAYIECMSACLHGNTLSQGVELVPLLIKSVEKAVSQPTQVLSVTEGLTAACLLLKLATVENSDSKMNGLWNLITNSEKQIFVSEKFITEHDVAALWLVMQLCEKLMLEHGDKLTGSPAPLHRAIVFCLASPSSSLRRKCRPAVRRIVSSLIGTNCACALLTEFNAFLNNPKIQETSMDINSAAVAGSITNGGGFLALQRLLSSMNIHAMNKKTYEKHEALISKGWEETAIEEMRKAAEEEIRLAKERGDVNNEGVPLLTVVADGSWAKRSYRRNYNSLSGMAAIVGYHTRQVLYFGVKNKYCVTCTRKPGDTHHTCFKNWNGSSSSMEAATIVEGFLASRIMRLRTAVTKAIQHRKVEEGEINEKAEKLRLDIVNGPSHVFDETDYIPEMKASGVLYKIMEAVNVLADHSSHLIYDVDSNMVEHYNAVVARFTGGKRINYIQKGSYRMRCAAAVVSHNTNQPFYKLHKTILKVADQLRRRYLYSIINLMLMILVDAIVTFCSGTNLTKQDTELLALKSLLCAHHPIIVSSCPNLWVKLVKYFKLDPKTFIKSYKDELVNMLVNEYQLSPSYQGALSCIIHHNSSEILNPVVERASNLLSDNSLLRVTKDEYFTFLTPAGVLYDKSVLPGKENENLQNSKNVKRESKVYSYKEQQEEMALRRELEEKKRRQGKIKDPELTPKQKEALRIQMEKEAAIRKRLTELNSDVARSVSMLLAATDGAAVDLSLRFKQLIPCVLSALQSPLSAPSVSQLYVALHRCAFPLHSAPLHLPALVAQVTLRLLKPKCDLDAAWQDEPLDKALLRTMSSLHQETCTKDKGGGAEGGGSSRLSAPAFCYCFPLLQSTLQKASCMQSDDFLLHIGLQLLSEHAGMRQSNATPDLTDPQHLPRRQMFDLLVDIISKTSGRIQQQASATLLDVAGCASGKKGCGKTSRDEIDSLLSALQNPSHVVRDAALRGLQIMVNAFPSKKEDPELFLRLTRRLWVARFEVCEENRELGRKVWDEARLDCKLPGLCENLLGDIVHPVGCIQEAGALALADLLGQLRPEITEATLELLLKTYKEKLAMVPPRLDSLGRVVEQPVDTWEPRSGVALALKELAPLLTPHAVSHLTTFFVTTGLGDRSAQVRTNMLAAALAAVDLHGKDTVNSLLPVFEEFLDKAPDSGSYDAIRQSVVILMGCLARHLDRDDKKIKPIIGKLVDALATPSQQVQEAVANCLPPLVPAMKEDAPALVQKLLRQLLESENFGERKGAAYGLAGLVKGMGILVLKQLDIMSTLTNAIQDKKNYRRREGALFAFEMLCNMLGRLFEPYIVHVLPHLLLCFGDGSQYVRVATDACARVVMSKLSAHGVKLVLPSLLAALEEDSWRTKTGSVELLGAMAYCAPKQLSSCLPSIVPKLIEVLSDSHVRVQKAGAQALKLIGSVIRNPEIQAIVPVLLEALQDPSHKTATCLQTLLDTQFVHFIDAPSLALIMPVVQRAFMDRSTETRKMAAQIIGNMYSLTDQKDLTPYLPTIIPGLKTSLLDPVPEVRSVSARALGAMVRGMGETSFEDLLPWLMHTLTSEASSVDRSGAAQGLSEVVGGLGVDKLHKLMPEIIATAERSDIAPHVKDGYIMMFIYMPVVFTTEFTPYIGHIIIPILKALADENEYVRDTALKAGQRIVNLYADSAIMLLLPELEKGLFDDNWRIRYSSVQLLGDLLYRISGVSGKMSTETANEDDNFGTEQSHKAIITALGADRRNRVLAGLYMGRSDVSLMVRQAALHVWKVVVTNTPRTLREILPTLFSLLLGCLASTSYDKRQVAARTLGDLVRKLGERILPEIIPILEGGLESEHADQRQGVCIGLSEIMASTSRDMVLTFVNSLVPTVSRALCDPLPEVRQAAAKTFDSLHTTVGSRALDDILPSMLEQLSDPDPQVAEWTLDGLRQVMAIKSRVVLPYLVPQLTAPPVNTKALSILAAVAGDALTKYLHKILPALLTALSNAHKSHQELEYCQAVVLSVTDEVGIRAIMDQLMEVTRSERVEMRRASVTLLCSFCSHSRADYSQYVPMLVRGLIHLFTDEDREVLITSWETLAAVTRTLDSEQQISHVGDVRQAVKFAMSDMKGCDLLPGFCLPKGITPILPLFREAILNGIPEQKEAAAQGLGEVIRLTSAQSLQPSVVHITGPLIRILGDRFNWSVKAAVLETLAILLAKVGVMLKQFLPQLQTTFLKALNDANRQVRIKAAAALSQLIVIHTRADPLFTDLHVGVRNAEDPAIRETMLQALRGVTTPAGDKMSEPLRKAVHNTLLAMLAHPEDVTRSAAAGCLGALCQWLTPEQRHVTLMDHLLQDDTPLDWTVRHGRSAALMVVLKESASIVYTEEYSERINKTLLSFLMADRVPIAMNGVRGCGYLFQHLMHVKQTLPQQLLSPFVRTMNHTNNEMKQLVARVCSYLAKVEEDLAPEFLKAAIPMLVNGTKEKNSYVKANSELSLVAVLRLRQGDAAQQCCMNLLEIGARESLSDVITKVLRKVANQPEGKEEELDDTLLT
ncbi:eIF-2-alpha kinase activator GCN1 [Nilaparvata lugens]|uniref:eIF-2-alpha kinase activator GCN1 n=1 Tax=Nilaparvata lugens TaxID=108931 RepID=UPI00193DBD9B|nr:eIF-2-alpha kinase activator GCN1 [Nilaparvata lugens]